MQTYKEISQKRKKIARWIAILSIFGWWVFMSIHLICKLGEILPLSEPITWGDVIRIPLTIVWIPFIFGRLSKD